MHASSQAADQYLDGGSRFLVDGCYVWCDWPLHNSTAKSLTFPFQHPPRPPTTTRTGCPCIPSSVLFTLLSTSVRFTHFSSQAADHYLDRLSVVEQVPWWWPAQVLADRRAAASGGGVLTNSTLFARGELLPMWLQPQLVNLMGLETVSRMHITCSGCELCCQCYIVHV